MENIIEKYYLAEGSKLVNYREGNNGYETTQVDCWFDTDDVRQHRCLSFDDFKTIKGE